MVAVVAAAVAADGAWRMVALATWYCHQQCSYFRLRATAVQGEAHQIVERAAETRHLAPADRRQICLAQAVMLAHRHGQPMLQRVACPTASFCAPHRRGRRWQTPTHSIQGCHRHAVPFRGKRAPWQRGLAGSRTRSHGRARLALPQSACVTCTVPYHGNNRETRQKQL